MEAITWADYAAQGKGLLDHLGIRRAHIMGACMGCSPVLAFARAYREVATRLVLYWPVGGPHYRISSHARFGAHVDQVRRHGLEGVVLLVQAEGRTFNQDPRGGPWASVIRRDPDFARSYLRNDEAAYISTVEAMRDRLFDRDTAPGATPEELFGIDVPALVVPGSDKTHATSAARYLQECLPEAEYWDVPVTDQIEATAPVRILEFLDRHTMRA